MKKIYLCVMSLAAVLVACSGQSIADDVECTVDERPMPPCLGDPRTPMVNLNIQKKIGTHPLCIRAYPGTTLVFMITPKKDLKLKTVEIIPKDDQDDADDWLSGNNDTYEDLIVIQVPEDLVPGDYNYSIKTPDKCVDPRVHVE